MNTPILHFVLILSLLLPAMHQQPLIEQPDLPYWTYLPLIGSVFPPVVPENCQVVNQMPPDGVYISKGTAFPVRWIIRNTSENI